jgi:hypothetical protein
MEDAGICPQMIRKMCASYNYISILYIAQLPRYRDVNHSGCTSLQCYSLSIDAASYQQKHTTSECTCGSVSIDVDEVARIIDIGYIPLIRISIKKNEDVSISVVSNKYPKTYHVVSHVWIDGLGNPQTNSMPSCQLKRLDERMQHAIGHHLWIDALCVPVAHEHKRFRALALDSMATIYRDAVEVWVMDAELQLITPSTYDHNTQLDCDMLGYTISSAWNSRCWTYQEAVLGPTLQFATAEEFHTISSAFDTADSDVRWMFWRMLQDPLNFTKHVSVPGPFSVLPPWEFSTFGFKLFAGPQAWQAFAASLNGTGTGLFHGQIAVKVIFGLAALLASCTMTVITWPGMLFIHICIWLGFHLVFAAFFLGHLRRSQLQPLSSREELWIRTRSQLAEEFAIEVDQYSELPLQTRPYYQGRMVSKEQKRFVQAWNSLAWRSTSKDEDLLLILACLTNLIPYRIQDHSSNAERMRAIIASHSQLPLALLFDSGLETTSNRDPLNPWLPLKPSGDILRLDSPSMAIAESALIFNLQEVRGYAQLFHYHDTIGYSDSTPIAFWQRHELHETWALVLYETDERMMYTKDDCFLIEIGDLTAHKSRSQFLRGAHLVAESIGNGTMNCKYVRRVSFTAWRSGPEEKNNSSDITLHQSQATSLQIAFGKPFDYSRCPLPALD